MDEIATFIHEQDPNHLVSSGIEGKYNLYGNIYLISFIIY